MTDAKPTPSFDACGHRWPMRITPSRARAIRDELGVDLYAVTAPPDANPFTKLAGDMFLLSDVLWALCKQSAAERGIDRLTFEDGIWDSIDDAVAALLSGVIESFPEKKRAGLRRLIAAQNAALDRVVEKLGPKMDQVIDAALDEIVNAAATRPDPSTPTSSPPA